ncbi:hypothetical protein BLNAU_10730 [Blattamonas nauphoetae]|uniref:Right handed beta helix domain-containing protein n=1 Tax=Blattamonas nauphoetae TaxID=2049346 RepID=A0ABQ9XPS7_9EUKA|nr:hypothetical protein BLNAU_10730 [Blattamonas nauphoetae]
MVLPTLIMWNVFRVNGDVDIGPSPTLLSEIVLRALNNMNNAQRHSINFNLSSGVYYAKNTELHNNVFFLGGVSSSSTILTSSSMNTAQNVTDRNSADKKHFPKSFTLLDIWNSTVRIENIHFSQLSPNCLIESSGSCQIHHLAVIDAGDLSLSFCHLSLNSWTSPFLVRQTHISENQRGASILVDECTLHSDDGLARGLVALSPSQKALFDLTISIVGTTFSNTEMRGTDGVAISFEGKRQNEASSAEISLSLVGNGFTNMTTSTRSLTPSRVNGLTQRMVGCAVCETSSHLCGSTVRDVQLGGSLLCSNTTFSALLASSECNEETAGTVQSPNGTTSAFVDGDTFSFDETDGGEAASAVFTSCSFTGSRYQPSPVTLISFTDFAGSIKLAGCSMTSLDAFLQTESNFTGLVVIQNSAHEGGFTCENGLFQNFNGSSQHGVFLLQECSRITFSGCHFEDRITANTYGFSGAIIILNDPTKPVTFDCLFANNQFAHFNYRGVFFDTNDGSEPLFSQPGLINVTLCSFSDCHGDFGHALGFHFLAPTTITQCTISECSANFWESGGIDVRSLARVSISDINVTGVGDSNYTGGLYMILHGEATIEHCTMLTCCGNIASGGLTLITDADVLVSDCHFVNCSSVSGGGGLSFECSAATTTIEQCSFLNCSSDAGAALSGLCLGTVILDDLLIRSCTATALGGMIFCFMDELTYVFVTSPNQDPPIPTLKLNRIVFVDNSVTPFSEYAQFFGVDPDTDPFVDFVLCCPDDIPSDVSLTNCFSTDTGDLSGTFKLDMDFETGEMLFLFSPSDLMDSVNPKLAEHAGSIIDQYTGEPRLSLSAVVPLHEQDYDVTVQRKGSSQAETMRVRISDDSTVRNWIADDETTTLDYLATYTITKIVGVVPPSEAASNGVFTEPKLAWEFDLASTPESLTFVAPEAPPILKASCRLGNGSNHAWIKLTGLNITAGTYTVTLVGVSGFSFGVTFASETDEKGRPLSEETSVRLFGEGSTLTFDTEYQIDTVINSTSQEPLNLAEMIITFTTPVATSRIIGMGEETLTLPQKDSVSVPLSGEDMKDTTYLVEVSLSDVVLEEPLSAVFSANSGTLVGRVYSASGSEVPLEYGKTYEVVSVTNSAFDAVLFNPFSFTVPTEPARIKSISPKLNREKSEVIVELTGVQFFASPTLFIHLKNTNTGRTFSSRLTIKNAESCSVSFPTAQSEDDTHLQFELGYQVTSVASVDGLSSFLFNEGLEVTVPNLPVVDTITSYLSPSCTTFQVSMTGSHLPLTGSFTATLSPTATMTVNFVDRVGTTPWLSDGVDGMKLYYHTVLSLSMREC